MSTVDHRLIIGDYRITICDQSATLYRFSKKKQHTRNVCRSWYTEATLKFLKLNTQAQQREAVVQGRSLLPYRLRYKTNKTAGIGITLISEIILKFVKICKITTKGSNYCR
ncbi:MAG: hypothetical protein LBJ00_02135 [Planctomycetaceae bacterium]|nr:hypothetical protein [Planctomycetaceae bacterium]